MGQRHATPVPAKMIGPKRNASFSILDMDLLHMVQGSSFGVPQPFPTQRPGAIQPKHSEVEGSDREPSLMPPPPLPLAEQASFLCFS